MSDRGSILISTANDIGEALVNKLGGEGYTPSVWDKEFNKLGIAEVDSAPALSVLEDSSSAETARGSILMSTANAIGAVLNKKYNTDRGFKPKEWASAVSKLAPLPEKSAESSPICAIEDGADDVPSRSLVVTIPPTLIGVSEVVETQSGRNLLINNGSDTSGSGLSFAVNSDKSVTISGVATANAFFTFFENVLFKASSYMIRGSGNSNVQIIVRRGTASGSNIRTASASDIAWNLSEDTLCACVIRVASGTDLTTPITVYPQIEVGSSLSDYETAIPTTYTADLGRTINGGTADIVNGEGEKTHGQTTLTENGWTYYEVSGHSTFNCLISGALAGGSGALNGYTYEQVAYIAQQSNKCFYFYASGGNVRLSIRDDDYTDTTTFGEHIKNSLLTYPLATPEAFTFDGQEIPTKDGYNAFWSEQGNTALDYYGEPEPYTRGTASGAIANVQSARTDLPFTMVKANIAPNFAGVDTVEVTKAEKNLFNQIPYLATAQNTPAFSDCMFIKGGTYTFSFDKISDGITDATSWRYCVTIYDKNGQLVTDWTISPALPYRSTLYSYVNGANTTNKYVSFSLQDDCYIFVRFWSGDTTADMSMLSPQLEIGSTATEYTPYEEPTIYTADLGEPVYGGYEEIVSGTGKSSYSTPRALNSLTWFKTTIGGHDCFYTNLPNGYMGTGSGSVDGICNGYDVTLDGQMGTDKSIRFYYNESFNFTRCSIRDDQYSSLTAAEFKAIVSGDIVYQLEEQTDLTFDGQVVRVSPGVNNLWNNAGGDTDVEYFTQE